MNKKILIILAVVIVLIGAYLILAMPLQHPPVQFQSVAFSVPGWKTCSYPSFGFQFQYPQDWNIYVYSAHQGGGNTPLSINCGDIDRGQLDPQLTAAVSPDWSSLSSTGGMQIVGIPSAVAQYEEQLHPIVSTSTIDNKNSVTLQDGTIIVNGYKISFSNSTPISTRVDILQTFHFLQVP
jgi:hypothetical protein